jgi:hypothetical protein
MMLDRRHNFDHGILDILRDERQRTRIIAANVLYGGSQMRQKVRLCVAVDFDLENLALADALPYFVNGSGNERLSMVDDANPVG